jgi:hypothetical protein
VASEDAARGSAIGAFVRDVIAGEPYEDVLARVPQTRWRATCQALDWPAIVGGLSNVRAEVAYGLTPASGTARELGLNLGRKYPALGAGEFSGTNDLEGRCGAMDVVCDLKSGRDVTECSSNPQMMFHAAARRHITCADRIEARLLYVREDGRVIPDVHVFRGYEIEMFEDALGELPLRIEGARVTFRSGGAPEVTTGAWCKYCPCLPACPAYTSLARQMLPELRSVSRSIATMTAEECGAAWLKLGEIERIYKATKESLKARAQQEKLPTRPGKAVTELSYPRRDFDRDAALSLLRAKGATPEEIDGVYVERTVSQIREVKDR